MEPRIYRTLSIASSFSRDSGLTSRRFISMLLWFGGIILDVLEGEQALKPLARLI